MELGTVVTFNTDNKYVLVETYKKTIKGVAKGKTFKMLSPKENFVCDERLYTKARAETAIVCPLKKLNQYESSDYFKYKKAKFQIWYN